MTMKQLASAIAKAEGKKHEASIGDVREILSIITTMSAKAMNRSKGRNRGPLCVLNEAAMKKYGRLKSKG